jgi:hypothetical protein
VTDERIRRETPAISEPAAVVRLESASSLVGDAVQAGEQEKEARSSTDVEGSH